MKNPKWFGKSPFSHKKKEEDAPIAARLRSRDNQVDRLASPTDKNSQNSKQKCNGSGVQSSSSSRARQVQSSSSSRARQHVQLSENPKSKSHETERNKRFAQPNKNEANKNTNASSSSQAQRNQNMKNVRFSEKSSEHSRPEEQGEDSYDLPVVEPHTQYIRSQERQRQPVGYVCKLCERDIGVTAFGDVEEEDSDLYPETSVFPCGHVYHSSCLRFQFGNQDITEGSCIFCFK